MLGAISPVAHTFSWGSAFLSAGTICVFLKPCECFTFLVDKVAFVRRYVRVLVVKHTLLVGVYLRCPHTYFIAVKILCDFIVVPTPFQNV